MFSFSFIKNIFSQIDGEYNNIKTIAGVGTDTRNDLASLLFVPLKGPTFDGHDYLNKAIEKGAVAALWQKSKPRPADIPDQFPLIIVNDTLQALQELALAYRNWINPKVIAITGSNGKTTTKDIIASICNQGYQIHFTKGNLNNHIGVPLTILSMPAETEVLIVEMGMNHFGEIERLSNIAIPDVAVITNIGESHIENLGSRKGIAQAKREITSGLKKDGLLIYDGDEPLLCSNYPYHVRTVGFSSENDMVLTDLNQKSEHTKFRINVSETIFSVPLLGKHHAKNAAYGIGIGHVLGINDERIQEGLNQLKTTDMRFQIIKGQEETTLINDAYNASPTSMLAAINVLNSMSHFRKKILILGDMFELGEHAQAFHNDIGKAIPTSIDYLCTLGDYARYISESAGIDAQHFETEDHLVAFLVKQLSAETIMLFKASRGMKFEQIIDRLKK
ncbi:UDP-N-acetylmuramoyl-tripeptide--D-alanyl-D-alanine ligase [Amphibacillus jilinensis]|uniref:UDP-N-acetylmuramoyl-tripeptide--D-alanyl-D- alanine ligase n=1 Tax=Amphibacillus jilinensis TaxID=1216008 RepID=UPI000307BFA8|nr:UDP-N-acetylmuramoyl-tripeptide--D-alanyl-D-alanine ligase [Amphibacillus jilinensis]